MREIGSEFWDVPIADENNSLFPQSTQWYLSGRIALKAIIKELPNCKTVAMPSWCCHTMIIPFVDAGIHVDFYPVYWQNGLVQEIRYDCDALLVMDYFGYSGGHLDLCSYDGVVIRDVTHSLFSSTYSDADYYFGSLRKWCGVWTGGYAWTRGGRRLFEGKPADNKYLKLREQAMQEKAGYIEGKHADKGYLKIFNDAEEMLDGINIESSAIRDVALMQRLDAEEIRKCRRANAEVLRRVFSDWLIFPEMKETDCPLFVPVIVSDGRRNELRHYLINNEIYCPVHWPVSIHHRLSEREKNIYDNELSLVCDQRYREVDMSRMVETINRFWKEV